MPSGTENRPAVTPAATSAPDGRCHERQERHDRLGGASGSADPPGRPARAEPAADGSTRSLAKPGMTASDSDAWAVACRETRPPASRYRSLKVCTEARENATATKV